MGWSMLSKGASSAAGMAKEFTKETGSKAAELSESVGTKIGEGKLLSGFGNLLNSASELGQKSLGGISQFVKSPSMQGFGGHSKSQYEDLGSPQEEKHQKGANANDHWAIAEEAFAGDDQEEQGKSSRSKSPRAKLTAGSPSGPKYASTTGGGGGSARSLSGHTNTPAGLGLPEQPQSYHSSNSSPSLMTEFGTEEAAGKPTGLAAKALERKAANVLAKRTAAAEKDKEDPWNLLNS